MGRKTFTPTARLKPFEKTKLTGFIDTKEFGIGIKPVEMKVHYKEKMTKKIGVVNITAKPKKIIEQKTIMALGNTNLLILLIIILILFNIYWIYKDRKDKKEAEKKK